MSIRDVAQEVVSLVVLANASLPPDSDQQIAVSDVRQFIAAKQAEIGVANTVLTFPVSTTECAVVVCIEEFNADPGDPLRPAKLTIGSEGLNRTRAEGNTRGAIGADLFYVLGPGTAKFTFNASPVAGAKYSVRVVGYYLPVRALDRLSRIGTRVLTL